MAGTITIDYITNTINITGFSDLIDGSSNGYPIWNGFVAKYSPTTTIGNSNTTIGTSDNMVLATGVAGTTVNCPTTIKFNPKLIGNGYIQVFRAVRTNDPSSTSYNSFTLNVANVSNQLAVDMNQVVIGTISYDYSTNLISITDFPTMSDLNTTDDWGDPIVEHYGLQASFNVTDSTVPFNYQIVAGSSWANPFCGHTPNGVTANTPTTITLDKSKITQKSYVRVYRYTEGNSQTALADKSNVIQIDPALFTTGTSAVSITLNDSITTSYVDTVSITVSNPALTGVSITLNNSITTSYVDTLPITVLTPIQIVCNDSITLSSVFIDVFVNTPNSIGGKVTLEDGTPVQGANVYAIESGTNRILVATTDSNGNYIISGIVNGNYYHVSCVYQDTNGNKFTSQTKSYVN